MWTIVTCYCFWSPLLSGVTMNGQSWPTWPHPSSHYVFSSFLLFSVMLFRTHSCSLTEPRPQLHWRRIHSAAQKLLVPKAQSLSFSRGLGSLSSSENHNSPWRVIFPLSYGAFETDPKSPFCSHLSSLPNPVFRLDPLGFRVYRSHIASSESWALFFCGFCDSATQYGIWISLHRNPWYSSRLSTKKATGGTFAGN